MVQIETTVHKPLPEDVYDRLKLYRERNKANHRIEVNQFIGLIKNGYYPYKCLECFKNGFSFCGFWLNGFDCDNNKNDIVNDIERLL